MITRVVFLVLLGASTLAACGTEDPGARSRPAADPPAAATDARAQRVDAEQVPAELRHLIPMAERWGIGDDVDRNAKVDRATSAEREELRAAVEPHEAAITAWLNSFGQGQLSDAAGTFMYMQLALEEIRVGPPR
jgi:nucleotidyltransferase/DNA polymerase involved in DNA repair